jgi:hypothetical protein
MRSAFFVLLALASCGGDIEKENVATTHDAGNPDPKDASGPILDATVADGGSGPGPAVDGGASPSCSNDAQCNGGTCFEGTCLCELPKYVQTDGRCGDTKPPDCATSSGTCRQTPAQCMAGELEGELGTNQSCGDFVAAVCCFPAASCKSTVDFVCCGASTTPYEPNCVNGWRQCMGLMPKLRGPTCP